MIGSTAIWNIMVTVLNVWSMSRPEHWGYWFGTFKEHYGTTGLVLSGVIHLLVFWQILDFLRDVYRLVRGGWRGVMKLIDMDAFLRVHAPNYYELIAMINAMCMCAGILAVLLRLILAHPMYDVIYFAVYTVYMVVHAALTKLLVDKAFRVESRWV